MDLQALLSLVAAGLGIAIVPESALDIPYNGITYVPVQAEEAYSDLILAWHKNNRRALLNRFLSVIDSVDVGAR